MLHRDTETYCFSAPGILIILLGMSLKFPLSGNFNGQERIRTSEAQVQQIYSLPPLATWVPALSDINSKARNPKQALRIIFIWSRQEESNPRPAVYKTAALPTELCRQCLIASGILPIISDAIKEICVFSAAAKSPASPCR